jgi:hypothetical protein
MFDSGIIIISFYCIIFLFGFLIVKFLKIENSKIYFTIIVSWVLWLMFAIFVKTNIPESAIYEGSEIENRLLVLYLATTMNPIHHIAMLFSLYKVIRGNIAK